ncbi:MAG: hypothetical protein SPG61_01690, partial [Arcanobacterium sp.]|nr:hypothetical protein [Arcanobacterium sp.]
PWSSYQDCDTRFGLVVISQDTVSGLSEDGVSFGANPFGDNGRRRGDFAAPVLSAGVTSGKGNDNEINQRPAGENHDLVAAFPGRGGFSQVAAHMLNVEQGAVKSIPWHNHGKKKYFVRTAQVISLMRRMKEVFAKREVGSLASDTPQRVVSWRFDGVVVLLGCLALIISGVWLLNI